MALNEFAQETQYCDELNALSRFGKPQNHF